jgi:hypothetical protein
LALLALGTVCGSAASPRRVLILNPFGRDVASFCTAVSAFRTTLARELAEPEDFYEERHPDTSFDSTAFQGQSE